MIITIFLNILYFFVQGIFGAISGTITFVGLTDGLNNFFASVLQYNSILPVDTLYRYIGYTVDFWLVVLLFDIGKFVVHLFRGN